MTTTTSVRVLLVSLLAWTAAAPSASAAVIGLEPASPVAVEAGDALSVDVVVSELGDQVVTAYDLDLVFDPALLTPTAVTFGSLLGATADSVTDFNLLTGVVDLAEVSFLSDADLDALQGDSVVLASVSFDALVAGAAELAFAFPLGNDVKGRDNQVIIDGEPEPPVPVNGPTSLALLAGLAICASTMRTRSDMRSA